MARKATSTPKPKATPKKTSSARKESAKIKQQKPVFRVGTIITVLLLLGLIGLAYFLKNKKETTVEETPSSQITFLFPEADIAPVSIEVKPAEGETFKVARNAENAWAIALPFEAEADQGLAEAAASQVFSLQIMGEIESDPNNIYGFDDPGFVITIEFNNGKKSTLEVGDVTPTNSGYYVRVDNKKMVIASLSGIDSLLQLAAFPPYLNTPTPSPLPPTETPITPEATVTPVP